MHYREFEPPAGTRDFVARYWAMEVAPHVEPGFSHRVLPDGCTDLVVVRRGGAALAVVRGPWTGPFETPVYPHDRFWGARLWPDTAARLLATPAASLLNRQYPAETFVGDAAHRLADAVADAGSDEAAIGWFDAWLAAHTAGLPGPDPAVRAVVMAIQALHGAVDTPTLARMVALSPRQLQRRFRDATGLTMKGYARVRRLRGTVAHMLDEEQPSWSEVAASLGFADHSHLIGEFNRLAGATPGVVARDVAGISHTDVIP